MCVIFLIYLMSESGREGTKNIRERDNRRESIWERGLEKCKRESVRERGVRGWERGSETSWEGLYDRVEREGEGSRIGEKLRKSMKERRKSEIEERGWDRE